MSPRLRPVILRSLGFFLVVAIPIIANSLVKQPGASEFLVGFLTALVFTAAFGIGLFLGKPAPEGATARHLLRGASFASIWALLIISFWAFAPDSLRDSVSGVTAWGAHMVLAMAIGWLGAKLRVKASS